MPEDNIEGFSMDLDRSRDNDIDTSPSSAKNQKNGSTSDSSSSKESSHSKSSIGSGINNDSLADEIKNTSGSSPPGTAPQEEAKHSGISQFSTEPENENKDMTVHFISPFKLIGTCNIVYSNLFFAILSYSGCSTFASVGIMHSLSQ